MLSSTTKVEESNVLYVLLRELNMENLNHNTNWDYVVIIGEHPEPKDVDEEYVDSSVISPMFSYGNLYPIGDYSDIEITGTVKVVENIPESLAKAIGDELLDGNKVYGFFVRNISSPVVFAVQDTTDDEFKIFYDKEKIGVKTVCLETIVCD